MDSTDYWQHVTRYDSRQFITGRVHTTSGFLPDPLYSQALDALVIGCADVLPVHNGRLLIGLRTWEPQPDWWCFGGRMLKGELYQVAALRNVKRELFQNVNEIEISPDRLVLAGIYNLIWEKRAQEPVQNGCHVLSVAMILPLTDEEIARLHPNEEYRAIRWVYPNEITLRPDMYHPCLLQMAKDVAKLIDPESLSADHNSA